jgi:hypothetical protein
MVTIPKRKALLVRVGIDSSYGKWNAPVNPGTLEFAYIPIPEDHKYKQIRPGYQRSYRPFRDVCKRFEAIFPEKLLERFVHLDPDFTYLTYGDENRKGDQIKDLVEDDIIAFYAGLRLPRSHLNSLLYAIIGLYVVEKVVPAADVRREDWDKNAHTRRVFNETDWVVFAKKELSGRLERCIPVGEWRNRAYRVRSDLLEIWGGLSANDGYIQRSAILPSVNKPIEFYEWFKRQNIPLLQRNN